MHQGLSTLKSSEDQALALNARMRSGKGGGGVGERMHKLWPAPPPKSPTARRRPQQCAGWSRGNASSFQRLRLTDIGARPPRPPSWEHGGPRLGSFLTLPRTSLSPTSSRSAPTKRYPPDCGSARDLASAQGPGRLLGPSLQAREGCSTVKQKRPPEYTQEPRVLYFLSLSRCQFAALRNGGEPRGEGACASALTTTAVTGWPGM